MSDGTTALEQTTANLFFVKVLLAIGSLLSSGLNSTRPG